jgi:NAD(P) transhydrogenase subunit beta
MRREAFGIGDARQHPRLSLVEMSLGVAIGALTFTGSVIAFLKLDGRMSASRSCCRHAPCINIALGWRWCSDRLRSGHRRRASSISG